MRRPSRPRLQTPRRGPCIYRSRSGDASRLRRGRRRRPSRRWGTLACHHETPQDEPTRHTKEHASIYSKFTSFASIARLRHDLRQSLTSGTSQYILNGRLHDRAVLKALLAKAENVAKGPQRAPWAAAPVSSPVPCSSASNPPAEALHLPSSRTPSRQYSTFG